MRMLGYVRSMATDTNAYAPLSLEAPIVETVSVNHFEAHALN